MRSRFLLPAAFVAGIVLITSVLIDIPFCGRLHPSGLFRQGKSDSPGALWVKLDKIDFKEESGVRKLTLVGKPDTTGDQTEHFEKAEPFKFRAP